ncbi:MAG: TonB-dependent receptor [Lewinellaceae bacterium]|nr:TonB-dependent receptor [Phaeodactylibacter sp.]MCB9346733.1 TonB-dependent receptor [Lewinellaceae bacterium]
MKNLIPVFVFLIILLFQNEHIAQGNTPLGAVKGMVIDGETQEPLPGVHILIEETKEGGITEEDGRFLISNLPEGTYTLSFSFIGYTKKHLDNLKVSQGEAVDLNVVSLQEEAFSLSEVTVTPGRFSIMGGAPLSRQTMTAKDIKNMSWAEDITRAVSRLPGVSSNDFSSKFTVRGGESDEVIITLDGMELYEPFHQRDYGGGLFSIVDIETIQGIDLMTGGFPAEYGMRQSGVFNMYTKRIPDGQKHTSVGLSIMNARVYTDGKFADNKGAYLFSGRRGMLDATFALLGETENTPIFYDVMGKVSYKLSDKHVLSFHTLHSGDKTKIRDIKENNVDRHDTKYGNTYGWLTLKSYFSPRLTSQTLLYSGFINHTRNGFYSKIDYTDKGDFSLTDKRDYAFVGLKQDWTWDASNRFALNAGFEARQLNADYSYSNSLTDLRINSKDSLITYSEDIDIQIKPSGQLGSAYLSSRFKLLPRLIFGAGLRYDFATYSDDQLWSPRLSCVYAFGENTFLRGAWGYYYQSQFINNLDVNHNGNKFNPAELSKHYVLGFEHLFPNGVNFRIETYYKDISNISPTYQNLRDPWEVFPESRNDVVKLDIDGATAKGIEVFLKYDLGKKISWWFSYALAKAEDNITNIEFDGLLEARTGKHPRLNDQRHTIYADLNYRPNPKWHFSLAWQYYRGWPRTNYHYEAKTLDDGSLHFYQVHEAFNGVRYPPYHRMDLRINRHFQAKRGRISTYVHLINLYNRANLRKYDLDVVNDEENLVSDGQGGYLSFEDHKNWFGFIPVIGASWEW